MVDARLPGRWLTDPRMNGLSDRAWRTFTGALMLANEAGTDGEIPQLSMRLLHPLGVDSATLAELVEANLFEPAGGGVVVTQWEQRGQELAEVVEARRSANRERQRKHREKTKKVTPDVTRDVTSESLRTGTGQERQGQALKSEGPENVTSWPVAVPGEGRIAS